MAFSQVQTMKATSTAVAGAAVTKAFTSNVTAGNRLFMFTDNFNTGGANPDIGTPTQSAGTAVISAFTRLVHANVSSAPNNLNNDLWTATVTTGGSCTLSATNTNVGGDELGWSAAEYSGLDSSAGSGCLDVSAVGSGNIGNTNNPSTGTTAATHGANQLGLCMVDDWGANATWTLSVAGGFTKDANLSQDNDGNAGIGIATKTSANGATESATWTSGISNTDIAWVAVIKLAAAAATTTGPQPIVKTRSTRRPGQIHTSRQTGGAVPTTPKPIVHTTNRRQAGSVHLFRQTGGAVPVTPKPIVHMTNARRKGFIALVRPFGIPSVATPQPIVHMTNARRKGFIALVTGRPGLTPVTPQPIVHMTNARRKGVVILKQGNPGLTPVTPQPIVHMTNTRRKGVVILSSGHPGLTPTTPQPIVHMTNARRNGFVLVLRGHPGAAPSTPSKLYFDESTGRLYLGVGPFVIVPVS